MNDPHVTDLVYVVEHDRSTDYKCAETLEIENKTFRLKLENGKARFELNEHFPSPQQAQQAVEPFIKQWELKAMFERGPGTFRLKFLRSEMIDRKPTPGVISVSPDPVSFIFAVSAAEVTVTRQYPQPPSDRQMNFDNPDVQSMLHRYIGYRLDREPLPSMAYFCYDVFANRLAQNARDAAKKHNISRKLMEKVRMLASTKGGDEARHESGIGHPLDQCEVLFLKKAVAVMITRAAMVAADPDQTMEKIDSGNVFEASL